MSKLTSRPCRLLACGCVTVVAGLGWAATYNWAGLGINNNWTAMGNWGGSAYYPGSSDEAIINDPSPKNTAYVDSADRTVRNLFIGDGMFLKLDNNLTAVAAPSLLPTGRFEGEGVVGLLGPASGSKTLGAEWHVVFSRQKSTEVTTDGTARVLVE